MSGMSQTEQTQSQPQPWQPGFMMPPQQQPPQPGMQPSNAAISTQSAVQAPPGPPQPPMLGRPYNRYVIPKSVVESSLHWKGSDADLIFGMREPTGGESSQLAAEKSDFESAVPRFICMIGDMPVTDVTQAQAWFMTVLTSKARTLVVSALIKMLIPSDAEGESLFGSQTRVG